MAKAVITPEIEAEIERLFIVERLNQQQIGKRLGIKPNTIANWMSKNFIDLRAVRVRWVMGQWPAPTK